MKIFWRLALLWGLFAIIAVLGLLLQRLGLGELAWIVAFLAIVTVIEGGSYVVRQFFKGYRGARKPRDGDNVKEM